MPRRRQRMLQVGLQPPGTSFGSYPCGTIVSRLPAQGKPLRQAVRPNFTLRRWVWSAKARTLATLSLGTITSLSNVDAMRTSFRVGVRALAHSRVHVHRGTDDAAA